MRWLLPGDFLLVQRFKHFQERVPVPQQSAGNTGKLLCSGGEIAVCHNYANVAVIHTLPCVDLLDRMISNIGGIALTLNSVSDASFFGKDINALVAAGLCDLDAGKGQTAKQFCTPLFKVIAAHRIDGAEDFIGSGWSGNDRRGSGRWKLHPFRVIFLFRFRRGGFGHRRGS